MQSSEALLAIALDLTASLASHDRLDRLLSAVRRAIACDAAAVLAIADEVFIPVATWGLSSSVLNQRFARNEHPRFEIAVTRAMPVCFPVDSELPDPYDGMLLANPHAGGAVHACLACPLFADGAVVGLLTADALEPGAFDRLDEDFFRMLGALAGAALQTSRLIEALENTSRHHQRVAQVLQRDTVPREDGDDILGTSARIHRVRDEIDLVAPSDFAVLITGETGVGKELVARAIHSHSPRRDQALIYVNCAALPETIVESELFGHLRGAFTGATTDRPGKFEIAHKGTLFLDEIGELPLSVQPKLLRALQEGEIQRVGSDRPITVDVRVIAATNRELSTEVSAGRFRADLFHRLNMYPIAVPPLRERRSDIPLLAGFFLDVYRRRLGLGPVRLTEPARDALVNAAWPGNVRELHHLLGRAVLRASANLPHGATVRVEPGHLQLDTTEGTLRRDVSHSHIVTETNTKNNIGTDRPLREILDETKRRAITEAVKRHGGNWAAAARSLGMARSNLHTMALRVGLRPSRA